MKDANKLGSPLRTPCKPPRTPYARWGEGSATRSTVEGDCSVWSSPVRQDCGASSARQAVQRGKLHLWMLGIHRDVTSAYVHGAIVARIYATHNPGFLQKTFRHTFATCKAEKGAPAYQLQQWLGHANLNTTQIYIHLGKQNARKIMQDTSI